MRRLLCFLFGHRWLHNGELIRACTTCQRIWFREPDGEWFLHHKKEG